MILFAAFKLQAQGPGWWVQNTGQNHTVLIPEDIPLTINTFPIDSGDYIGVFYDSLGFDACGGFIIWDGTVTALTVWGADLGNDGFISGELFRFKIWDSSNESEYKAIASYSNEFPNSGLYLANGLSALSALNAYSEKELILNQGWNMIASPISSLIKPDSLFSFLSSSFILCKDAEGSVLFPEENLHQIDSFKSATPYWVKMLDTDTLPLFGIEYFQENVSYTFVEGIQYLPYLLSNRTEISKLFGNDSLNIRLIRDEAGKLYWPELGMYDLKILSPNKSYFVDVKSEFSLSLKEDSSLIENNQIELQHFIPGSATDKCMYFGILNSAWDTLPEIGDEIAITDLLGNVFGAGVYNGSDLGFAVWGDDEFTDEIDGMISNQEFIIKIWRQSIGFEDIVEVDNWHEGDSIYSSGKYNIVGEVRAIQEPEGRDFDIEVLSDYVNGQYYFDVSVPYNAVMVVDLFSIRGQLIGVLIDREMPKGKSRYKVEANLEKGIYLIRMQGAENLLTKLFYVH